MNPNFETNVEIWYSIFQFLTYTKNKINDIYYPYQVDSRGHIYNGLEFVLNPTTNKVSRLLVGFGQYYLTIQGKIDLKNYIFKILKIQTEEEFLLKCKSIAEDTEFNNVDENNIKDYILLIDWITNVEVNRKTEILIEIEACQSGFQMLSLLSNDYKGMLNTNLIKSDKLEDLYSQIFNQLEFPLETYKILNIKLIKRLIMSIPYGSSTLKGHKQMVLEAFNKEYGLENLLGKNEINLIISSNIITSKYVIELLKDFQSEIVEKRYELKDNILKRINYCKELLDSNLYNNFLKKLVFQITNILKKDYINIMKFSNYLRLKSKVKFEYIQTQYYKYSLNYYKVEINTLSVGNSKYSTYSIKNCNFDYKKKKQGIIANICHGLGDAFIIYKILSYNINIYPIHDAILCKSTEINRMQKIINRSYNEVYTYIIEKKIFEKINKINKNNNIYVINSFNIFK